MNNSIKLSLPLKALNPKLLRLESVLPFSPPPHPHTRKRKQPPKGIDRDPETNLGAFGDSSLGLGFRV